MFDKTIAVTQFTSPAAGEIFQNITGESYRNDVSFLSVMRALLYSRMPKEESINLTFFRKTLSASHVVENGPEAATMAIIDGLDMDEPGQLRIISLQAGDADNDVCLGAVQDSFEKLYQGYAFVPKFTEWFKKAFKTQLYINSEKKSALILVDRMSIKKLHVLLVGIPVALPWYFSREVGFTEEEDRLLKSFANSDPSFFEQALDALAGHYDFRSADIRRKLSGFELRYEREYSSTVKKEIEDIDGRIADYSRRISDLLQQKDDKNIMLIGLMQRINAGVSEEESEIMQYFIQNQDVFIEAVTDSELVFRTRQFLEFFDEDYVELALDNSNAECYLNTNYTRGDTRRLLKAIFLDHILKVQVCATYTLRMRGTVRGVSYADYNTVDFAHCMPNPHIHYHACLGNYELSMNRFLQNRNYIGAIDQCIASCKSLNWRDYTVIKEFFRDLLKDANGKKSCIQLPDGRFVDAESAIAWLKENEVKQNEQEAQTEE